MSERLHIVPVGCTGYELLMMARVTPVSGDPYIAPVHTISANDADEVFWSIYKRQKDGRSMCLADFHNYHDANAVYTELTDLLKGERNGETHEETA